MIAVFHRWENGALRMMNCLFPNWLMANLSLRPTKMVVKVPVGSTVWLIRRILLPIILYSEYWNVYSQSISAFFSKHSSQTRVSPKQIETGGIRHVVGREMCEALTPGKPSLRPSQDVQQADRASLKTILCLHAVIYALTLTGIIQCGIFTA